MLLKAFDKYIAEFLYAEAYFPTAKAKRVCRFNRFRSRRQYLNFCTKAVHSVWEELNTAGNSPLYSRYVAFKLEEAGKMFIFEGENLVSHRNLLVFQKGIPVSPKVLNTPSRRLLRSFLQIQYFAWQELCRLCETFYSVYHGYYVWKGKEIELLELGDALWTAGYIYPLPGKNTKKLYFQRLFGFFNLEPPDDPCHRLGELGLRSRPDAFLSALRDKYCSYWEEREG